MQPEKADPVVTQKMLVFDMFRHAAREVSSGFHAKCRMVRCLVCLFCLVRFFLFGYVVNSLV